MLMKTRTEPVDRQDVLEDLLSRWHGAGKSAPINGTDRLVDPTFNNYRSYRGWDEESEVHDAEALAFKLAGVEFAVAGDRKGQGAMPEPYKAAIYILARNCYTGRNVWLSPRLPQEPIARGEVIADARNMLIQRLRNAGVME